MTEPSRAHEAQPPAETRARVETSAAPLAWAEKQAAYAARRAAWDRGQAAVEAERIRLHGRAKP
jgi:hypothetical protein